MKTLIASALIVLALLATSGVHAGNDHAGHSAMQHGAASVPMQMVEGQVKKVDKSGGKVTLSHGPLENLNMPAMTMAFGVKNASWLDQMKSGDKIRFMAENVNGAITVVHFEASK